MSKLPFVNESITRAYIYEKTRFVYRTFMLILGFRLAIEYAFVHAHAERDSNAAGRNLDLSQLTTLYWIGITLYHVNWVSPLVQSLHRVTFKTFIPSPCLRLAIQGDTNIPVFPRIYRIASTTLFAKSSMLQTDGTGYSCTQQQLSKRYQQPTFFTFDPTANKPTMKFNSYEGENTSRLFRKKWWYTLHLIMYSVWFSRYTGVKVTYIRRLNSTRFIIIAADIPRDASIWVHDMECRHWTRCRGFI